MRWLPAKRRTRIAMLVVLVAGCLTWWVLSYRPWEAHYRGRPTSWWARELLAECERTYELEPPGNIIGGDPESNHSSSPLTWLKEWSIKAGIYREMTEDLRDDFMTLDPGAIPVLLELLRHPNPDVRMAAAWNDHQEAEIIRATIFALVDQVAHSPDAEKRLSAIFALRCRFFELHPEAFDPEVRQTVVAALSEALRDERVRERAGEVLMDIDPAAARRAGIEDPDP